MHPVQYRGLGMKFNLFFVLFTFLAHQFLPKYDVRMQLLMFQIKMLRDRIDDQRIVPTSEERAELLRLGNEINHDVADVMLVVKPQTYRRWLSPKAKARNPKPAGRPGTAEDIVTLILRIATENLSWGYKRIFGELKNSAFPSGSPPSATSSSAPIARRLPRRPRAGPTSPGQSSSAPTWNRWWPAISSPSRSTPCAASSTPMCWSSSIWAAAGST
jgi:hypothetical protein